MARQTKTNQSETKKQDTVKKVLTQEGIEVLDNADMSKEDALKRCEDMLKECIRQQEGLSMTMASTLFEVEKKSLWKLTSYTSTAKWAEGQVGLSKQSVSEILGVMKAFADPVTYKIVDKLEGFAYSKLVKMKSLSTLQIELAEITPEMTRDVIVQRIKDFKEFRARFSSDEEFKKFTGKTEAEWNSLKYSEMKKWLDDFNAKKEKEKKEEEKKGNSSTAGQDEGSTTAGQDEGSTTAGQGKENTPTGQEKDTTVPTTIIEYFVEGMKAMDKDACEVFGDLLQEALDDMKARRIGEIRIVAK